MTELPPDELAALPTNLRPGTLVLELGNKKNRTGLYRDWYLAQGLNYESVDWNGLDGAWEFDMMKPHIWTRICKKLNNSERFALVTNFGFTEHVGITYADQLECWRNVHGLVDVGGFLSLCMPVMPDWKGHGRWMPTPEWYHEFAETNGYRWCCRDYDCPKLWERKRRTFVGTLLKTSDVEFVEPIKSMILRSDQ